MTQRVLVTGGAGYLGSIFCEHLLRAGHRVTAIDNLHLGQHSLFHLCSDANFYFIRGDARDKSLIAREMKKCDVVVPLAAIVGAPACDADPFAAKSINLDAVLMLNKLRSRNQLLLMPITNSGYGTKSGEVLCTEDSPLEPISLYGRTKVDAEQAVLETPNAITLRLATVFGMSPRMRIDLLVNHFVYAAVTDGYIVLFEKDFKRNFVHVRDVADGFIHCIENSEAMIGKPYNLGLDDANLSKEELALAVKRQVPDFVIQASEIRSDPDKRNYIVSNQRLREAGFEAKRSLPEGIAELLKGYRAFGRMPFRNI